MTTKDQLLEALMAYEGTDFLVNDELVEFIEEFQPEPSPNNEKNKVVDGFVWLLVTDKAKEIYNSGLFELYELHKDGSESLISTMEELNLAHERGNEIGIEAGRLDDEECQHPENELQYIK